MKNPKSVMELNQLQLEAFFKSMLYVLHDEGIEIDEKYDDLHNAMLSHSPHNHESADLADMLESVYNSIVINTDYLEKEKEEDEE